MTAENEEGTPLTDDQVWGSVEMAQVVDPECLLAGRLGGCPRDCTFCDDHPATNPNAARQSIINNQ